MSEPDDNRYRACREIRDAIQETLDGPVPADKVERVRQHTAGCHRCREYESELRAMREALRSLPEIPFPDEALDEVWSRTVRSDRGRAGRIYGRRGWWAAAAAILVLAVAVGALLLYWPGPAQEPREPTRAELEQAADEVRLVLALTSQAMQRTERAAVSRVLAGEVSPALRRIPIRWPESKSVETRRSQS